MWEKSKKTVSNPGYVIHCQKKTVRLMRITRAITLGPQFSHGLANVNYFAGCWQGRRIWLLPSAGKLKLGTKKSRWIKIHQYGLTKDCFLGVFRHTESKSGLSFVLSPLASVLCYLCSVLCSVCSFVGLATFSPNSSKQFFSGFRKQQFLGTTRKPDFPEYTPPAADI